MCVSDLVALQWRVMTTMIVPSITKAGRNFSVGVSPLARVAVQKSLANTEACLGCEVVAGRTLTAPAGDGC